VVGLDRQHRPPTYMTKAYRELGWLDHEDGRDIMLNYIIYNELGYATDTPATSVHPRSLFLSLFFLPFVLDLSFFAMVKLSLPTWDRDKSQFQAGTSFTPSFAGRLKSSASSTPSVLRRFKSPDPVTSSQPSTNPLMILRLSSPSFLDSVVHDGSSENPLYVIDTDDNITKVRRSDPKGFVNVSRVRWPTDFQKSSFRKNKDLTGVEVVFGRGHWKPADEFLGYSYGSLSRRVLPCSAIIQPIRLPRTILAIASSTSPIIGIA